MIYYYYYSFFIIDDVIISLQANNYKLMSKN